MVKPRSLIGPEIEQILNSPKAQDEIKEFFNDMHPYDIFVLCEDMADEKIAAIIKTLGAPLGIDLFQEFDDERKLDIFEYFSRQWMADILEEMAPDERADFVKVLPEEKVEDVLPLVARAERVDIKRLMEYEEGTAGSILTTDYAHIPADITVKQAMEKIKSQAYDSETIYYVYVIDNNRKLLGFVTLRDMLVASSSARIENIMHKKVVSAMVGEDVEAVAKKLSDYDFLAIPIVDDANRLLGIVTVDDVVDVVIEESTEDMYKMGAVGEYTDYMKASPLFLARQRSVWLLILIFVGFISAWILEKYAFQVEAILALSFFIPLLLGAGGNAGTQSSTVVIRGLAMGEIDMKDLFAVFRKELFVGTMVGLFMAVLAYMRAYFIDSDPRLGITVGLAMVVTVMLATSLGALLPIMFKKMKLDPALMSGPFITSIVDIVSLIIYFKIAIAVFW